MKGDNLTERMKYHVYNGYSPSTRQKVNTVTIVSLTTDRAKNFIPLSTPPRPHDLRGEWGLTNPIM